MMVCRCIKWLILSLLFCPALMAQDNGKAGGDSVRMTFEEFVRLAEQMQSYRFYYDDAGLDSIVVTTSKDNINVPATLQRAFTNTTFHFAIDSLRRVFVTRGFAIETNWPAGKPGAVNKIVSITDEPVNKLPSLVENKLFEIGQASKAVTRGRITLAGYIKEAKNGEPIVGAVINADSNNAVVTNQSGYYTISLTPGQHLLKISNAGMQSTQRHIIMHQAGTLNVDMTDEIASLKEVVVLADRKSNTRSMQMGMNRLTIKAIKQVPVVFGEADVLKVVLTLPGVTSIGEASTGLNVRGGSADQNLILFNDATIYNPSHLFGFFSVFNPDVVKGIELYKSAIPEKFGGRLSSVLDVSAREGNNKKISGAAGIGPLTSKLMIEGPIVKDKTSFIIGGRTSYSNWLLHSIKNSAYKKSDAGFNDIDLHISHTINKNNTLYLSGYMSHDRFKLNTDTLYKYSNKNINLRWRHVFNNSLYAEFTGGLDYYQYSVEGSGNPINSYKLMFDINQKHFRSHFNYTLNNKHVLNAGFNTIYYEMNPGTLQPVGTQSLVTPDKVQREQALETAVYAGDQYSITDNLSLNAGIRYSLYNFLGPRQVDSYAAAVPRDKNTITGATVYAAGKAIKTYHGPEIRVGARYSLSDNASIKLSYNTLRQYIHMLSNTSAISPTDIWKLSDTYIQPQLGEQISLGFYRNFKANTIEASLEVYYKRMKHFLDYKSGANLVMNHRIETDIINTRGKAYGVELLVKKVAGKANGWFSYTYSRTWLQADDPLAGELINRGDWYPANADKPHNVNVVANYRFSHRVSVSLNMVYTTGRPVTLPIAVFTLGGAQRVYYSDRNQHRIPDYFRTDLSVNIDGNHKVNQLTHNSWSVGVYNLTARQNAYSVYFIQQNGLIKGYQLSIFGTIIPFVTYNIRF